MEMRERASAPSRSSPSYFVRGCRCSLSELENSTGGLLRAHFKFSCDRGMGVNYFVRKDELFEVANPPR